MSVVRVSSYGRDFITVGSLLNFDICGIDSDKNAEKVAHETVINPYILHIDHSNNMPNGSGVRKGGEGANGQKPLTPPPPIARIIIIFIFKSTHDLI